MYYLYRLTNTLSGTVYYGISNNPRQRFATHKHVAKAGKLKSKLADAMRAYGADKFSLEVVQEFSSREAAYAAEVEVIAHNKAAGTKSYNLHPGGSGGFSMMEKSDEEIQQWRAKQRLARKGKTPALGMKHTEETKALCGEYGKLRWDIHGRYDVDAVVSLRCVDAMRKYGVSKTHYYRLKRQHTSSAVCEQLQAR